jgi:predicted small lipoprotein YifL
MQKMIFRGALTALLCCFLLAACGQKGDLYLPEGQLAKVNVG